MSLTDDHGLPHPQLVDAPADPAPGYGLVVAAPEITDGGSGWFGGITWYPLPLEGGGPIHPNQVGGSTDGKDDLGDAAAVEYHPFAVWAGDDCSGLDVEVTDVGEEGDGMETELDARARALLARQESFWLERELWTGALARAQSPDWPNAYLTRAADLFEVPGSALPVDRAIAEAEQAFAELSHGARPMIHMQPRVEILGTSLWRLDPGQAVPRTALGSLVVAGSGYPGTAPGSAADADQGDATSWVYLSRTVHLRRGTVHTIADFEHRTNHVTSRAERMVATTYDPDVVVAVEVDLTASAFA